jgi:hypothetical protein
VPKKKLTDLFVERVKAPASGRAGYFDAAFPGLAPRVTNKGANSFSVFDRISGRLRRFMIGNCPPSSPPQPGGTPGLRGSACRLMPTPPTRRRSAASAGHHKPSGCRTSAKRDSSSP